MTKTPPGTDPDPASELDSAALPEMLLLDDPSDFRLHAAYLAYSEAWTKNADPSIRHELNGLIQALHDEKDFSWFYQAVNKYRAPAEPFSQTRFKAKKKRAWRRSEAKKSRLSRHKK